MTDPFANVGHGTSPDSPTSHHRRRKSFARKVERACCSVLSFFPLVFVYGLTTWAVWVEAGIGFAGDDTKKAWWIGPGTSFTGIALWSLLNLSYTVAVFTDPGSPLTTSATAGYSSLPTQETGGEGDFASVTVKSSGDMRFCKKCQTKKPDRTHHCSTCRRCVLKMDHHCPWLATCVGLRNYKPFLLFLLYTTLFCWICFVASASWMWNNIFVADAYVENMTPVNNIMLTVISCIIGMALTGFTAWHLYLASSGQTTIEKLEKTRYLSPLRKQMSQQLSSQRRRSPGPSNSHDDPRGFHDRDPSFGERMGEWGEQLREIHANALPGVTRPEEGVEDRPKSSPSPSQNNHNGSSYSTHSPAAASLRAHHTSQQPTSWLDREQQRERDRYADYLDEQDSDKLPNAFDLGWRRNLRQVFGDRPLLWLLPVCNSPGDGWRWEASPAWVEASERISRERRAADAGLAYGRHPAYGDGNGNGDGTMMQNLPPRSHPQHSSTSESESDSDSGWDKAASQRRHLLQQQQLQQQQQRQSPDAPPKSRAPVSAIAPPIPAPPTIVISDETASSSAPSADRKTQNWNDIPEDFAAGSRQTQGSSSRRSASSSARRKKGAGRKGDWEDWSPG